MIHHPAEDLFLAETGLNEVFNLRNHLIGIGTLGDDVKFRSLASGQHHEAHDALAIDALAILLDPDLRPITTRYLDKHGGRARVQAVTVLDHDLLAMPENVVSWFFARKKSHYGYYRIRRSLIICSSL